jgi:hypothetical protein
MHRTLLAVALASGGILAGADKDFAGRWDIEVPGETRSRAWWLEVSGVGTPKLKGRFVGAPGGNMDDIPEISIKAGELKFVFERNYSGKKDARQRGVYRARLVKGQLDGTYAVEGQNRPAQKWIGRRAPIIRDKDDGSWKPGVPVALFNGKDLAGWKAMVANRELGWEQGRRQQPGQRPEILELRSGLRVPSGSRHQQRPRPEGALRSADH